MLRFVHPPRILSPASAENLKEPKEDLHVLGKGQCFFTESGTIGYPYFQLKRFRNIHLKKWKKQQRRSRAVPQASLLDKPLLWAGRLCIFYVLLKMGIAGPQANPLPENQEADNRRKLVSKWHPTTKGTLKRSYRVPIKSEGRRLLKAIASLLSDDDTFRDATSHKGCQIRRENAHGETVCCNNVRALFDELPTPHLVVEITPFPAGPLSEPDYLKAEKIERVLRTGASI